MGDKPRVTICVPCRNSAATLARTLDSILAQTHRELNVVVVDNASSDATADIAEEFARRDRRLSVRRYDEPTDYVGNWNRCLKFADGDYTALYHADDVYLPEMVEREVLALQSRPDAGLVFTGAVYIDENDREIGRFGAPQEVFAEHGGALDYAQALKVYLRHGELFMAPSALARTAVYRDELREFLPGFGYASDIDAWLRIAERHRLLFLPEPLMRYRRSVHSGGFAQFRARTTLSDGFLSLGPRVRDAGSALDDEDRRNLSYAVLKDKLRCGVVALIQGNRALSREMAHAALTSEAWALCAWPRRRLMLLAFGWGCWLASFLPLPTFIRAAIFEVRFNRLRPHA